MPLRTSLQSLNEREAIEREWETERSFPLANLSTQRRSALRFVPATKTDEEWTRATRAGLDASFVNEQSRKLKSSQQIAADNAQWYRELVGSRSATPKAASDSVTTNTAHSPGPATGSNVTLEKLEELEQKDRLQLDGQGTRAVPFTLSDDDDEDELAGNETNRQESPASRHFEVDADQDNVQSLTARAIARAVATPSSTKPPLAARDTPLVCPTVVHVQPAGSASTDQQPADVSIITIDDADEAAEPPPEDMFCVLCKVLVPASDVPTHLTSILHQLSRHPGISAAAPLVPPTHYHLRANTNIGYGMLERLGWQPEQGLGSAPETGRKVPVRVVEKFDKKGVGADSKKRAWDDDSVSDGKPKLDNQMVRKRAGAAKPLAKNRQELEKAKKSEMQMFRAGLAYLNS